MIARAHPFGRLVFDRGAIVRAALRAYIENILSRLDRLGRHNFTACAEPRWTGDLQHGAFYNGNGCGDYAVAAWTEAGVVGLAYELGFGPLKQLGLSVDAVTRGPDDVRPALPELPSELEPALVMAAAMLAGWPRGARSKTVGSRWCVLERPSRSQRSSPGRQPPLFTRSWTR